MAADIGRSSTSWVLVDKGRERDKRFEIDAELALSKAHVILARLYHAGPDRNVFRRENVYWIDLCLTPRRPNALARYCEHWSASRFVQMGSLVAFPPRKQLELRSAGGRHASLICELQADAVEQWFPPDFAWTERRLDAALHVGSEAIQQLMMRLSQELRNPQRGSRELSEAIVDQIAIELARFLVATNEPDTKGGLASWRLRAIDERISDPTGTYPTAAELAALCRLSVRQFSRAFRTTRGCTVSYYLAQSRIESAKRRLYTNQPIAEIAAALGFSTQSSFTAAFRRATGTTPGQFRKRLTIG